MMNIKVHPKEEEAIRLEESHDDKTMNAPIPSRPRRSVFEEELSLHELEKYLSSTHPR